MGVGLPSSITTRYTRPVISIADIEALERLTYDSVIPARNLYHLFEATARLHPDRPALTVLTKSSRESDGVSLTHRELLVEIFRAADLFRSLGITPGCPTVATFCSIAANIKVEKDDKLNTVVRISVDSCDPARTKELTEALSLLPQTYQIENPS